jgi:hypothetical protein
MTKTITLADYQSISIPSGKRFFDYEVEVHPADPYPWHTLENLRPHLLLLEDLRKTGFHPKSLRRIRV